MTYEELKNKYDELVSQGVDVLTLKGSDEMTRSLRAIGKVKAILDDCTLRGIDVFELKKGMPEYHKVKDIYLAIDGKRVALLPKMMLAGYSKRVRKAPTFEELQERLNAFVESGKDLARLRELDFELYQDIKNSNEKNFDKRSTLFEKIKVLGYNKPALKSDDVEEDLRREIFTFKANGGDINTNSGEFPFKEKLWATMKKYRRRGISLSMEEVLRKNGAEEYSEIYAQYRKLFELENFRDEQGYVDSYRSDEVMNYTIDNYSAKLDIPPSIIVLLIANEKLKQSIVHTDVIEFTKKQVGEFLVRNGGSFRGIKYADPQLLERLHRLRVLVQHGDEDKLSTRELVEFLGFEDVDEAFKPYTNARVFDIDEFMSDMANIAKNQEGKIYRKDIPNSDYHEFVNYANRLGLTIADLFSKYEIEYVDYRNYKSLGYVVTEKYPYIDEMIKERDEKMAEFDKLNPNLLDTIRFEYYLKVCEEVYKKYKPLISNLGMQEILGEEKPNKNTFGE